MKSLSLLVGVGLAVAAKAQEFKNMDFELGRPFTGPIDFPIDESEWLSVTQSLFPGWTLFPYQSTDSPFSFPTPMPGYNSLCLGSPCVALFGPKLPGGSNLGLIAPHGRYSIELQPPGVGDEMGISQVGKVRGDAKALWFAASGHTVVRVDDMVLSPVLLAKEGDYGTYAVDVSPWSGKLVKLSVSTIPGPSSTFGYVVVDYFRFSTEPLVPVSNPNLAWQLRGSYIVLTYLGILQSANRMDGPYSDVLGASSPYQAAVYGSSAGFFRARN